MGTIVVGDVTYLLTASLDSTTLFYSAEYRNMTTARDPDRENDSMPTKYNISPAFLY